MLTHVRCSDLKVAVPVLAILTVVFIGGSTPSTAFAVRSYISVGNYSFLSILKIITFAFNAKSFAIAILVFSFFFFFFFTFSGGTAKSFLANVLTIVMKKTCDQDLTHFLDTPKHISVKIVPQVVIRDACGTWYGFWW